MQNVMVKERKKLNKKAVKLHGINYVKNLTYYLNTSSRAVLSSGSSNLAVTRNKVECQNTPKQGNESYI
jgi:hypothetical protein